MADDTNLGENLDKNVIEANINMDNESDVKLQNNNISIRDDNTECSTISQTDDCSRDRSPVSRISRESSCSRTTNDNAVDTQDTEKSELEP